MKHKEIEFSNTQNEILRGKLYPPSNNERPIVFMLTGDGKKGSNGLSWINLPKLLMEKDIGSFVFDFSGLGNSEGKRRDLTLSKAISDAKIAFDAMLGLDGFDKRRIGVFGASFGGNVALLTFSNNRKIKVMTLKSPVSFYPDSFISEFGIEIVKDWKEQHYIEKVGFDFNFYLDAFNHNTYLEASKIQFPCLIIHGDRDEIVPVNQSWHLSNSMVNSIDNRLVIKKGVNHRYSNPGAWNEMSKDSISFLEKYLSNE